MAQEEKRPVIETRESKKQNEAIEQNNGSAQELSFLDRLLGEYKKPALAVFRHSLFIVFGIGVLSLVGWLVEISHISEVAKDVIHRIDEYLMIFAFVILGIGFIMEIVTVVLGGPKKHE